MTGHSKTFSLFGEEIEKIKETRKREEKKKKKWVHNRIYRLFFLILFFFFFFIETRLKPTDTNFFAFIISSFSPFFFFSTVSCSFSFRKVSRMRWIEPRRRRTWAVGMDSTLLLLLLVGKFKDKYNIYRLLSSTNFVITYENVYNNGNNYF